MISIFIPAKNEAHNLPACLESVRWSDDIHVLDSGSTDETAEVARAGGAQVTLRGLGSSGDIFGGDEAAHKNWALTNIPFKYDWVLHLDADERVTPELALSIARSVQSPAGNVAYRIRRRDFWGKTWLKHAVNSSYYIRLFRPEKMRYERVINPVSVLQGPVGELDGFLDHYPFSKGITHWLDRHNGYSSLEARQIERNRLAHKQFSVRKAFFAKDRNERRFHQKEMFYRLPARPLAKFLLLYVGKRGFLDGRAGFNYAMLQSFYEYMIVLKSREIAASRAVSTESGLHSKEAKRLAVEGLYADQNPTE